jgi:hypothetical protein
MIYLLIFRLENFEYQKGVSGCAKMYAMRRFENARWQRGELSDRGQLKSPVFSYWAIFFFEGVDDPEGVWRAT